MTIAKTALTGVALGVTAYSRLLGRTVSARTDVPIASSHEPVKATPADVATAQKQLKVLQWGVPALTGAIVVLKDEHKEIRKLFGDFQGAGHHAAVTKGKIAAKIIEKLTVHTFLENEIMNPQVRKLLPELESDVLESYEEHHVADVLVMELVAMKPEAERFDAKMTVLIENVTHHMGEEENNWFPKVRKGVSRNELQEIGALMLEARKTLPVVPLSRAP